MKLNNYIIAGLIAVAVTVILSFFISLAVSGVIAIAAAVIIYFILASKKGDDKATDSTVTAQETDSIGDKGIESLLDINLLLRKSIVPVDIRDSFEQVIDQLLDLLPKVNEAGPDGELAWVINRMATEYLPEKSIKPYLDLDEANRHDKATMDAVEDSLVGMKSELADVESILSKRKTTEFNKKAKFLKQRFDV